MKQDLINSNIPENKVFATGIPLSNRFLKHYNKSKIMTSMELNPDKKVILFFGGGEFGLGREQTLKILKAFINNVTEHQIVAISGKNEKMKLSFEKLVQEEHAESIVKVLGIYSSGTRINEYFGLSCYKTWWSYNNRKLSIWFANCCNKSNSWPRGRKCSFLEKSRSCNLA